MRIPNPIVWKDIPVGTIRDADILALARAGELITDGFVDQSIKQACYELQASEVFYETSSVSEKKRIEVTAQGYILRPRSYVTAIVKERIELPPNVLARILTKGQLFSIGILPVCTYADPGFKGRLGITLYNASNRHIVLKPGQAIAKIEFSVLSQSVVQPYSGQHGYETKIWPIPVELYANDEQLRENGIDPTSVQEVARSFGPVVADTFARFKYYEKRVWLHIAVTIVCFLILFRLAGNIGLVASVSAGIVSNLITNLIFWIAAQNFAKKAMNS
jgi:dCTP deaminase